MKLFQKYYYVHITGAGVKRKKRGYIWHVIKQVRNMYPEDKVEVHHAND